MTSTENIKYIFEVVGDEAVKDLNAVSKGLDTVGSGFTQLGSISKSFSRTFTNATKSVNVFKKAVSSLSGVAIGKILAEGTKSAIDFYETLNLFNVAMKDSIDAGEQFIDTVSEWYGLDPKNLMDYTGLFYEMAYAVEAPDEAARILSTSLTSLSVDLASLFNVDVERVADNLTSGLRGMSRAVVKYGLDLRATTAEAYANSLGITEQYETMNEASREILRYLVAVKQARDATGDFGRTIEQPANQMRVFKEQVTQLGRAIGTFLVQPLQSLLPVINGTVMALRIMLETIASLIGITTELAAPLTGMTDTSEGFESIGASADAARKKVKAFLAPFDELNVMQDQTSTSSSGVDIGGVDPILLEQLQQTQYVLEEVRMKAMDTRDAVLNFFGFSLSGDSWVYAPEMFERQLKAKLPGWTSTIEALFQFDYSTFISRVAGMFGMFEQIALQSLAIVLQDFAALFGVDLTDSTLADWIAGINAKLLELQEWLGANEGLIATYVARVLEVVAGLTALAAILSPIGSVLVTVGAGFFLLSNLFGGIGTALGLLHPLFSGVEAIMGVLGTRAAFLSTLFTSASSTIGSMSTGLAVAGQSSTTFMGVLQTLLGVGSKFAAVFVGIQAIMAALFIASFVKWAATSDEFKEHLARWGESLKTIFTGLKDIFTAVFQTMGNYIEYLATTFSGVFDGITGIISGLLEVLAGLVEFVAGVFTGDWKRALRGVADVFWGLAETLNSITTAVINLIIIGINKLVVKLVNGIIGGINTLLGGLSSVLSYVGINLNVSIPSVPSIPPISAPPLAKFATGGVVTGPTRALIGEAGRAEAVIPLDNSPQMNDLIQKIASAVSGNDRPLEVHVYMDSQEVAYGMYDELENIRATRGAAYVH